MTNEGTSPTAAAAAAPAAAPSDADLCLLTATLDSIASAATPAAAAAPPPAAGLQGLTLVHFSAQHKRFLWDRGVFTGCVVGAQGLTGYFRGGSGCILSQKRLRLS